MDHPASPTRTNPGTPGRAVTYETMAGEEEGVLNPGDPGFFFLAWLLEERAVIPMVCMVWWGVSILITLLTHIIWFRTDEAKLIYGDSLTRAHLVFVILGMIVYFTIAATCWYYAAQYATTRTSRKQKTIIGIGALWFLNDLPLWAIEFKAARIDTAEGIQTASFVLNTLTFLAGGIVVWLTYAYKASGFLHYSYAPPPRAAHPAQHTGSVFPERGGGIAHLGLHSQSPATPTPPTTMAMVDPVHAGPVGGIVPRSTSPTPAGYSGYSPGPASFQYDPLASVSPQRALGGYDL